MVQKIVLTIGIVFLLWLPAAAQEVYKTPSGQKYHLSNCRMVRNVSEELTLTAALAKGLSACKICNPPKSASKKSLSRTAVKGESVTVRCKGTTRAGTRCRHMTSIGGGFCFQHKPK